MPYRRKGSSAWYTNVATRTGWTCRSTGTRDKPTARAMERMLADIGPKGKRDWDLLDALATGRLTMGDLFDAYRIWDLDGLRDRMQDVDLEPKIADWQEELKGRVALETRRRYLVHLRSLIPEGRPFWRSEFTEEKCAQWLNSRPVDRGTKRKYFAAANSFFGYLRRVKVLKINPLGEVKAPRANKPRVAAMDLKDVRRLLDVSDREYRRYFALVYGTGIEVTVALRLKRGDVDVYTREIRAAGTKTHSRDRIVRVAEWAWPDVEALIADKLPEANLFTLKDRSKVSKVHLATCKSLGLIGFRLHDASTIGPFARRRWAPLRRLSPPSWVTWTLRWCCASMVDSSPVPTIATSGSGGLASRI